MNMKKSRKVIGIICLLVAAACIGYIVYYYVKKEDNGNVYEKVQKQVAEHQEEAEPEDVYVSPIDFGELQKLNPDIYAWIQIEGTNINYPIVQSATDDAYYLNHTIEGQEGYPGSIYTEKINAKDFTDFNTVIYGHNMKDGTMFKDLHNYEDEAYLNEHPYVIIYTPDKKMTYQIFAAVVYNDSHIVENYDFTQNEQRQAFLDSVYNSRDMRNTIKQDVQVNAESNILTMSTCIGNEPNNRFIVEAVLLDEE